MTSSSSASPGRAIVASVGTDHHRFDRLVRWLDEWCRRHPDDDVFVQFGTSAHPRSAQGEPMIRHADLLARFAAAEVVVTHGGPATISDALDSGRMPLVVPRDPTFGEHVDDHQQRFARYLAAEGHVHVAEDSDTFFAQLDRLARSPAATSPDDRSATHARTVQRFGALVAELAPE